LISFKPDQRICKGNKHKRKLQLTDLDYHRLLAIDVIIRADVYSYLQRDVFHRRLGELVIYRTIFGWVLTGTVKSANYTSDQIENLYIKMKSDLSKELQKFWELEELPLK